MSSYTPSTVYVPPNVPPSISSQASDETIARLLQQEENAVWYRQQQIQQYPYQPPMQPTQPALAPWKPPPEKPWYKNVWMWLAIIMICIGLGIGLYFLIKHVTTSNKDPNPYWLRDYNSTYVVPIPDCLADKTRPSEAWFDVGVQEKTGLRDVDGNAAGMDQENSDNFDALTRAFSDCRNSNGCRIFVRPGIYRFTKEQPLFLRGVDSVTIDGQGSMFLFRRETVFNRFMAFETTKYLTIKNLRIDWDWSRWRIASLVEVINTSFSTANPTMDLRFMEVQNISLATIHKWYDLQAVDGENFTYGVRDENRQGQYWGLDSNVISAEKIYERVNVSVWDPTVNQTIQVETNASTSNHVRLSLQTALQPVPSGFYLIRHFSYEGHALQFVGCSYCIVDNVTVYSAIGMGIAFHENSHHILIKDTKITIFQNNSNPEGSRGYTRHISLASDGINFINTQGFIEIRDTEIGFQGDDCLNINDRVGLGFSRVGTNRIMALDWEKLRVNWKVGDVIEVKESDLSPTIAPLITVTSSEWKNGQGYLLGLDQDMPSFANPDASMVLVNRRYNSSNIKITRLVCHSNRSRGAVLQGLNMVVEQSCFSNQQKEAIRITSERNPGKWAEGSGTRNTLIVGNYLANVDELDNFNGVIKVIAEMGQEGVASSYVGSHQNVTIRENTLHNMPRRSIMIASSTGVIVTANKIENDEANPPETAERGQITVARSSDVWIGPNIWTTTQFTTSDIVVRGPDCVNVTFVDNIIR
jgi:hypothetical protein